MYRNSAKGGLNLSARRYSKKRNNNLKKWRDSRRQALSASQTVQVKMEFDDGSYDDPCSTSSLEDLLLPKNSDQNILPDISTRTDGSGIFGDYSELIDIGPYPIVTKIGTAANSRYVQTDPIEDISNIINDHHAYDIRAVATSSITANIGTNSICTTEQTTSISCHVQTDPVEDSSETNNGEECLEEFFRCIAKTVKAFPPHLIAKAKIKFMSVVTEMKEEAFNEMNPSL